MAGVYVPRSPTTGVLYGVVRGHWSEFEATVRDRTDGGGLPTFVTSEFRKFLRCGVREQVATSVALGGRGRRVASHTERSRLIVTKAIKAALAKIRANDSALGRHLATSIRTGTCCVYDPGPSPAVAWDS